MTFLSFLRHKIAFFILCSHDDNELFLRNGPPTKGKELYFQLRRLSDTLTITQLLQAAGRI